MGARPGSDGYGSGPGCGDASRVPGSLFLQIYRAAVAKLPGEWFELHAIGDDGFESGREHAMLERVGGPPVGSFHIWLHGEFVYARALPELDQAPGEVSWADRFRAVPDALEAIAAVIDAQLRAWTLPSWKGRAEPP